MSNKILHKSAVLKAVGDDRDVRFIASTETADRYGDTVNPKGWDTKDFDQNPVFLMSHNSGSFPIGRVTRTWEQAGKFMADVTFMPEGMHDIADKAWAMVKGGFMNAVSVGFMPKQQEPIYDDEGRYTGTKFIKQSLLELSLCAVPANPEALQVAKSLNFSKTDRDFFFVPDVGSREVERAGAELETLKLRHSDYITHR